MIKRYFLFILFGIIALSLPAQGLTQAKNYYEKGQYDKAKPIFKKLVKTQAANGNYHLWYGVCCLHTDEPELAVKHLETAVKKRIPSGQFYLGQAYNAVYRFEDAIETFETYREELAKRKRPTTEADSLLERSRQNLRMLKGVEKVCFIDSIVVDKEDFLEYYKLSHESGRLCKYGEYLLDSEEQKESTVYKTELENKTYYGERQANGLSRLMTCDKIGDGWSQGMPLAGIDSTANANYPYVMADGVTLYYASDGPSSMGGYDIFVTRYNSTTDSYLTPENVGMPFNSPYNDYMFVIDEFNNLGWFASDRFQPKDKVCLYIFIPNPSKQVYNYENMDIAQLRHLASIHAIKESWTDNNAVNDARQRLAEAQKEVSEARKDHEFEFVIDDNHTYYYLKDFKSAEARKEFNDNYRKLEKTYRQESNKLENKRLQYAYAGTEQRRVQAPSILDLEKRLLQLREKMHQSAMTVRRLEKKALN